MLTFFYYLSSTGMGVHLVYHGALAPPPRFLTMAVATCADWRSWRDCMAVRPTQICNVSATNYVCNIDIFVYFIQAMLAL